MCFVLFSFFFPKINLFSVSCLKFTSAKDIMYSPDVESSPAPSSSAEPHMMSLGNKQTSRTSSFEIENLLKTAEQVSN